MPGKNALQTYHDKRDLRRSPEPKGAGRRRRKQPRFVIHKHDASSLHYDFRLEAGGALKSWAVPKGPSTDPRQKRLAMPVEDHPLDYADFEGVIPQGQYGAGTVIVWDTGSYRPLGEVPVEQALQRGHVSVWLERRSPARSTGGRVAGSSRSRSPSKTPRDGWRASTTRGLGSGTTLAPLASRAAACSSVVPGLPDAASHSTPGVEQVDDSVDAVTAGALVGGLEEVKVSAHGCSKGSGGGGGGGGQQWAEGLAERVDLVSDRAARAAQRPRLAGPGRLGPEQQVGVPVAALVAGDVADQPVA